MKLCLVHIPDVGMGQIVYLNKGWYLAEFEDKLYVLDSDGKVHVILG